MQAQDGTPPLATASAPAALPASERLAGLADAARGDSVTLNWILAQLGERAFGVFLLILALPCCIPFLYGVPQVVSVPLMFVAGQLALGRTYPWLPARLGAREIKVAALSSLAARAGPWLKRIEIVSRPRLTMLTGAPFDRIVGTALVLFAASILLPIPLTNTVPGAAVVIVAAGLLQRDGLLVLGGLVLGTAWIASLIFAGASLISLIMGWAGL
ncbi:MAG: exopolysaccharide biosynthesis protein [Shimia sp.]